jgi:hypothetical protein
MALRLKAGVVESDETAVAIQRLGKQFFAAINTHAIIKNCWTRFLCGPCRIK